MIRMKKYLDDLKWLVKGEELEELTEAAVTWHLGPGPHTALPRAEVKYYWATPEAGGSRVLKLRRIASRLPWRKSA